MAETKKTTSEAPKKVFIKLPINNDPKAPQEEFFSYNFKNYIIKRGVEVEIPEGLAQMIKDKELAAETAFRYVVENALREA